MPSAERRKTLLDSAIAIFARDGLGYARHAEIAKHAGVALATVFHYFATRTQLVNDVLGEVGTFFIRDLMQLMHDEQQSEPAAILAILMRFSDTIDSNPGHAQIWLEWSTAIHKDIWPSYLAFHETMTTGIAEIVQAGICAGTIRQGLLPMDVARIVVGMAHPVAHMRFSGSSRSEIEHTMSSLVGQYLMPMD
jgi:TetR/AcrR family hemagglutinin/protease transcriptional regulator